MTFADWGRSAAVRIERGGRACRGVRTGVTRRFVRVMYSARDGSDTRYGVPFSVRTTRPRTGR